jgi:hypothetical protein
MKVLHHFISVYKLLSTENFVLFLYLKDLIGDTCQRPITAERSNFEDVNAPSIDVVKHRSQCGFMRRLNAINWQAIARE